MKDIINFSFKLLLLHLAASVISFISMFVVLSTEIGYIYKVLIGIIFIAFIVILCWNNSYERGLNDVKSNKFFPLKGLVSASIAMLPSIMCAVIYLFISYNGFDRGISRGLADALYLVLYFIFLPYCPLLAYFVPFNPSFSIDFAQPSIVYLKNITMPNAVSAPMFLLPIALFILVAVLGYTFGSREQKRIIKQIKNKC